ncbi:MAG TPA: hypothetical protein VGR36_04110 [Candidatus Acidoferrales bacterium]|nr:hypothetical protein [Candidatus Acidoferrales bacterium]
MPFRPRELVVRAREAAITLVRAVDRDEMVEKFLDVYAAENRRPGRADHPGHYREQLETIRREAILTMVLRIEGALPRRLKVHVPMRNVRAQRKSKRQGKARSKKPVQRRDAWEFVIPILDLFREEFFTALGQALEWTEHDAEEFWRDLELYEKLRAVEQKRSGRSARAVPAGPFVDRVAFILDPSLMEQARRATAKFESELDAAADRVLRTVLSRRSS